MRCGGPRPASWPEARSRLAEAGPTLQTNNAEQCQPGNLRRALYVGLATGLLLLIHFLPLPAAAELNGTSAQLTNQGKDVLAILVFCIVLWITEAVAFPVTALMGMALLPLLGVHEGDMKAQFAKTVRDGFGNTIVLFLIGTMIMAAAVVRSGLDRRLALSILRLFGNRPSAVLLGFLITGCLLSLFLSDLAVTAMLVPIGAGILAMAGCRPLQSNFGRALMMAAAWGPLFGGIGTPAGTGANVVVIGFLRDLAGLEISFAQWMVYGLPTALLLVPCGWLILLAVFPPEMREIGASRELINEQFRDLGRLASHPTQIKAICIPLLAIVLWIAAPQLDMSWVALASALLLFLPYVGFLEWKEAGSFIQWQAAVLVAGGLSIGVAAYETGLASYIANLTLGQVIGHLPGFLRYASISWMTGLMHAFFSSNTLTASIMAPLLIPLADAHGLGVWSTLAPAAFTSSLAFLLVTSCPTSVVAHGSGHLTAGDYARAGVPMTIVAGLVIATTLSLLIGT